MTNVRRMLAALAVALPLLLIVAAGETGAEEADVIHLRLLETTDLHGFIMPYNYGQQKEVTTYGFALTASLIKQARSEVKNSLLFDIGDLLQGSYLDKFVADKGLLPDEVHPMIRAMNLMGYDAATVGNHEFNYGIRFMNEALDDANFPYVSANLFYDDKDKKAKNDIPYFRPYVMLNRTLRDENGQEHELKIGVIGLTLPQTIAWNRRFERLGGILKTKDIYKTAKKYVPIMKKEGADVIVALSHNGLGKPKVMKKNNETYSLTTIKGIDAVMFGHIHKVFPSKTFAGIRGVNLEKGTINGVAAVEAGRWGSHLGVIDLTLKKKKNDWKVVSSHAEARPVFDPKTGQARVQPNPEVVNAVHAIHEAALNYMLSPSSDFLRPQKSVQP
ncbi:MAG TPA: metallophosphoesterase [Bacillales bacterium]|nr:metallophosphoesterase [Bacillales bacterium]